MANLYKAPTTNYWSTTLNGSINDSVTTITLNSTTNLQAPGFLVIDREDGNGNATPNSREVIYYTGISGNDITGVTRGADGSTARSHGDGALVEAVLTVGMWNDLRDGFAAQHTTAGAHIMTGTASAATMQIQKALISTASIGELTATNVNAGVKGVFEWTYSGALATSLVTASRRPFWRATKNLTLTGFWAGVCSAPSTAPVLLDIEYSTEPDGTFTSIFTTKPFIDIGEKNSASSATVGVLNLTSIASGTILQPEVEQPGDAGILLMQLIAKERV